eukprot:SAG31_NODE_847_length_11532_cov_2.297560_10_plen_82_part_00
MDLIASWAHTDMDWKRQYLTWAISVHPDTGAAYGVSNLRHVICAVCFARHVMGLGTCCQLDVGQRASLATGEFFFSFCFVY